MPGNFYLFPKPSAPIRQGDIFKHIPWVFLDPSQLIDLEQVGRPVSNGARSWVEYLDAEFPLKPEEDRRFIARIVPSYGIVFSQDCDATRDTHIVLFRIAPFFDVFKEGPPDPPDKPSWWGKKLFSALNRVPQKWFYLPPFDAVFTEKMATDFKSVIPVERDFLLENREKLRIGRLNYIALEHFREVVAQYFKRYAYNEWYPLNKEEFEVYINSDKDKKDSQRFRWQK